ncbi:hypothetical protein MSG28_007403 [Choristoneura fumiferana]|uniref:Uncharacterized protein n=1 Tax=Choristoneura fumiferana TaxID=7141 RepID=A0ACC0JWT0_CHOFU|nr:hypothetical protein MSG28_007403 [Choristoneura fumiferana]
MNPTGSSTALSADLNSFIYGVSRRNFQNALELTKIGISLLKTFPAARDAVLEYFAMMFHSAVNVSINPTDYEADPSTTGALDSVNMIGPELCGLGGTLQTTEPIRTLLDITAQNLTLLDTDMRAKCIDMMLVTDEVVQRLWVVWSSQRHTAAWEGVGPATLVALLVRADVHCTLLLLQHAACRQLLEYLLQKLEFEGLLPENDFPLLASAAEEAPVLRERLLVGNQLEQLQATIRIREHPKLPSPIFPR